jgi:two-component system, NarL family, nitrate/nitrite response regulator NarL
MMGSGNGTNGLGNGNSPANGHGPQWRTFSAAVWTSERLVRECLARALEATGLQVFTPRKEVAELVEILGQRSFDVALVEARGSGAPTLFRALRAARPDLPLLALGVDLAAQESEALFEAGASACMDCARQGWDGLVEALATLAQVHVEQALRPAREEGSGMGEHAQVALPPLSPREREVLSHISGGMDNLKIAAHLGLSERTVKAYVSALYRKLAQENRTQLALVALRAGLRPPLGL